VPTGDAGSYRQADKRPKWNKVDESLPASDAGARY
jgi:hypothetical protein